MFFVETLWLLLDQRAELEHKAKDGRTPLYIAAQNGRLKIVGLMVDHGAHIEHQDHEGRTTSDCALEHDWVGHDLVYLLLQAAGPMREAIFSHNIQSGIGSIETLGWDGVLSVTKIIV
jgi:ankyrin repeat protein